MPTATELITQVRDILDEPTAAQWTDMQLRRWLNEGNRDLARATRHIKGTKAISTIPGLGTYQMPADIIAIEQAWYFDAGANRQYVLTPRHMETLDTMVNGRWDLQGIPQFYTTQGFSPQLQMLVYPIPVNTTADQLLLMVARLPVEIKLDGSQDSIQVDVPSIWYDALADYCEFKALRKDRDQRWQDAYKLYTEKRDALIENPDYLPINREVVADPKAGYLPRWLVDFDY